MIVDLVLAGAEVWDVSLREHSSPGEGGGYMSGCGQRCGSGFGEGYGDGNGGASAGDVKGMGRASGMGDGYGYGYGDGQALFSWPWRPSIHWEIP